MLCFFFTTYIVGADEVRDFYVRGTGHDVGFKRYLSVFLAPGIGCAVAAFPKPSSEYSDAYYEFSKTNALSLYTFFGWLYIVYWIFRTLAAVTF